ncbi:MAG: hypothetical protein AUI14_17560 [Actinobacteria bacterium 13_2_20CM_2_71_6]|nr:MAG: hypothetical protein AUI14_17560 [Actinobacteria bacterium 13_2_20CM_2_71_6]
MMPDSVPTTPKATAPPSTTHTDGRDRRRVPARAPPSEPTASAVVSSPKVAAPLWKTFLARTASVNW